MQPNNMLTCACCFEPERARAISVAPMIEVTDRHFRMLVRIISRGACPQLWSEMTWDRAILYNAPSEPEFALNSNAWRPGLCGVLGFSPEERPLVLQLGGSEPEMLARAAKLAEAWGYDEVNLNCGCPAQTRGRSRNCYGARLMFEPERVAACCAAIAAAVSVPVSVKMRLGVNEHDSYAQLHDFVSLVSAAGVSHFYVHARKAILNLDTTKNRSIPPLRHEWVFALIADFPQLRFILNGGVASLAHAAALLCAGAHGVMIGRRANADPYMFALTREALEFAYGGGDSGDGGEGCGGGDVGDSGVGAHRACEGCGSRAPPSRREVLASYGEYADAAQAANWGETTPEQTARALLTPLTGLFHNTAVARVWKQAVSALLQDRPRLLSTPVREILAALLDELFRSPGALSELAPSLLDGRPTFSPGPLPRESQPPPLPCVVLGHERSGRSDEQRGGSKNGEAGQSCGKARGAPGAETDGLAQQQVQRHGQKPAIPAVLPGEVEGPCQPRHDTPSPSSRQQGQCGDSGRIRVALESIASSVSTNPAAAAAAAAAGAAAAAAISLAVAVAVRRRG